MQTEYTPPEFSGDPGSIVAMLGKVVAVVVGAAGVLGSFMLGSTYSIVELAEHSWEDPTVRYNWGLALFGIALSVLLAGIFFVLSDLVSLRYDASRTQDALSSQLKDISGKLPVPESSQSVVPDTNA